MTSRSAPPRAAAIDLVAGDLLTRASRLTRLAMRQGARDLSRTEAGLLHTLLDGPRRITDLAETEALAQPTVTQLVDRLQQRGLVQRERCADDGRVVRVSISGEGRRSLDAVRTQTRALLQDALEELGDEELAALVGATQALARLIDSLQRRTPGP